MEFMLVFRFEPNFTYQPTEEETAQQHQLWGTFIGNLAMQEKLVSTNQLGFEGNLISSDKSVSAGIKMTEKQIVGGNLVVKAATLEEATEIGKNCPILLMGGNVEVRNILPMN